VGIEVASCVSKYLPVLFHPQKSKARDSFPLKSKVPMSVIVDQSYYDAIAKKGEHLVVSLEAK